MNDLPSSSAPVADTASATGAFADQPVRVVERDGVRYTLLGTAHVSQASLAAVKQAIDSGRFDAVAVELDAQRLQSMTDPDALTKLDLVQVIRSKRLALFAVNLGLAAYQRRLAEQLGIEPGAELKGAVLEARARNLPVHLIDRDVGLTFRRASGRLELRQPTILAHVAVVLLVAAVVLDQGLVVLAQRAGDRIGQALQQRAAQAGALRLDVLDRMRAHQYRSRA